MLYYYILIQSRLENPHVPIKCPIQLYYVLPGHHVKISTYSTEYWNFSDSDSDTNQNQFFKICDQKSADFEP